MNEEEKQRLVEMAWQDRTHQGFRFLGKKVLIDFYFLTFI